MWGFWVFPSCIWLHQGMQSRLRKSRRGEEEEAEREKEKEKQEEEEEEEEEEK